MVFNPGDYFALRTTAGPLVDPKPTLAWDRTVTLSPAKLSAWQVEHGVANQTRESKTIPAIPLGPPFWNLALFRCLNTAARLSNPLQRGR